VTGSDDVAASAAAFGRWARQERELRGLTREELVKATRLAPAVVDGLESGDPARMPPRGYVYGYLRTWATALGLDADEAVLRWQEVEAAEAEAAPAPRRAPRARSPLLLAALVAAGAVAAGALVWLLA
jgi:cytoskeletal protein RodZ